MEIGDIQRQSLLHFGTSVIVTVLGFLSTMVVTHLSGTPEVPGGYFLFLAYFGIFSLISSGGLGGAAVTLMSTQGGARREEYYTAYLGLRSLLLVISVLLLLLFSPALIDLSASGLLPWLIGAVVAGSLADIVGTWLYSAGRAGYTQVSTLINNLVRIAVQVIAIICGYGVAGLAGSFIAGILAGTIVLIPFCRIRTAPCTWSTAEDLLRFSFWALLSSGGMVMYGNIDTILIGYYGSPVEVGLYRIALQLASFALFSTLALNSILYPKFALWRSDSRITWIQGSLARAISYSLFLAIPVCVGGTILGDRLLYFLYGSPYASAGPALTLLLLAQVAYVFVFLWSMTLGALGQPKKAAIPALIASAVNIPLNIVLIPAFGISGASLAVLITVLVHAICAGRALAPHFSLIPDIRAIRSILMANLVMGVVLLIMMALIPITHFLMAAAAVLIGALVYLATLVRLERGIDTALGRIMREMGIVLPEWL
ncbi:MAG TPA: oligosaccharide flippase family protein [Methanospirillum sp.]|nr:oligosaccharide flippase family protein [Methanospirillum sp.]